MSWWNRPWLLILLLLLAAIGIFQIYQLQINNQITGSIVSSAPVQKYLLGPSLTWQLDNYEYKVLAQFEIEAKVLSRKDYSRDRGAEISPFDLALGWGVMSKKEVLDQIDISQGLRWYSYSWRGNPPADPTQMAHSSSNFHIIPGSPQAYEVLKNVTRGDIVRLKGYLVDIKGKDGWRWTSSLSRTDTGNGACELLWVNEAIISKNKVDIPSEPVEG